MCSCQVIERKATSAAIVNATSPAKSSAGAPTPGRRRKKSKSHSAFAPLDAPALRAFCLRVLAHLQAARGWRHTPDVLYLDFPSRR